MSKINLILLLLFCIFSYGSQQSEAKLEGKPFSSDGSSNSLSYAFDGDLSTEFFSPLKDGWVGLELSKPAKITKIGFAHKSSELNDYLFGVFQGANDETFLDAFPLYMITEESESNTVNYIPISIPKTFKYVRYVGPENKNSTISEFEIYGVETEEENEELENLYQPTNLPLVIINSGSSQMPQNRDRETRTNINFIIVNEGKVTTKATGTIKLRGNSSLNSEKKPYGLKFDENINILDLPAKAKKWVLVPNMYDKSLLRNLVGYKMSSIFGLKFSPACSYIDLIVNGSFRGNYLICDKIEVKKDRLDLAKMDETCVDEPEITGGYLLEGQGSKKRDASLFKTNQGITLSYEYPSADDITEEQKNYINNFINQVEAEIYDNNAEHVDLESFVRYFLVEDFSANQDEIFNSFFIYKERGDDKVYFGPVWDFDLAFDNAQILYPTNEKKNFAFKFGLSNGSANKLVAQLLSIDEVLKKVKDVWAEMTNTVFTKEIILKYIDDTIEYINESQKLNFKRWDVLDKRQFMEAATRGTYEAEAGYFREFMEERFDIFGELVSSATTESVLEEVKGSWGFPWGGGDQRPWGQGDRPWGQGDKPWGDGNQPWGQGNQPWGNGNGNGEMPWGEWPKPNNQ